MMSLLIPQTAIWAVQAGMMAAGFLVALLVLKARAGATGAGDGGLGRSLPLVAFAAVMTGFHLWILTQPMEMRF